MAPHLNNTHAVKLSTDELKRAAYTQYCSHIASGYTKKSWRFKHPDIFLTWETMEKYIREEPNVFDPIHKKMAECDSLYHWESVLADSATGKNKDANTASLQMIMRNKFKWDTRDHQQDEDTSESAQAHDQLMKEISHQQKAVREIQVSSPDNA